MDAKRMRPCRGIGRIPKGYEPTYARGQDVQCGDIDTGGGVHRDIGSRINARGSAGRPTWLRCWPPKPNHVSKSCCQRFSQRVASVICASVRLIQFNVAFSQTATEVPFCSVINNWEPGAVAAGKTSFTAASDSRLTALISYPSARRLSIVACVVAGAV
jgi:hypothetical protein